MPRDVSHRARCPRCRLHLERCLCAALPVHDSPVAVTVVQHWKEARKPTSTGHLLSELLAGADRRLYGQRDTPFDPTALDEDDVWLVFPPRDPPDPLPATLPRRLVFVDGTWAQARRMARRIPALARLPRIALHTVAPPRRRLREPPTPEGRATLEACADVLAHFGHKALAHALLDDLDRYVQATLAQRGLPSGAPP